MSENLKINETHRQRCAYVYIRQSSPTQVQHNRESTDRQYQLRDRALQLGWSATQIRVVDEDLAHSGSGLVSRQGFGKMTQEVALGRVGIILCLEASRLARNNAEWYRLLELCGVTDTLLADLDGLYHPGLFNDRLLLGLKGTMAEAELHVLRMRLNGAIRNKARRGELRRGLPVGLLWGEGEGEVVFHPDQAVTGAVRTVFEKFAELGSARQVWLWFQSGGVSFPHRRPNGQILWVKPTYIAIHAVLSNPAYAGAYAYGKCRWERYVDETGRVRNRVRHLPQDQWAVLIREHHPGFIDWATFEMNQARLAKNAPPPARQANEAVREGSALLQGLATCGRCGRHLRVYYQGRNSTPGYYCEQNQAVAGRALWCMRLGGVRVDRAVVETFLEVISPAGLEAALAAQELGEAQDQAALRQFRLQVERTRYEAQRAERRYRAVEPENRLVARTLETQWEKKLNDQRAAEAELARKEQEQKLQLTPDQRRQIRALGSDLKRVWEAPSTTDRDRKELLRTLLEEVRIDVLPEEAKAHLLLRWKTGAISELDVVWRVPRPAPIRTDEATIELLRRLARHHPDRVIAGVLNRQSRTTARGQPFTANRVSSLRTHWKIPCYEPPSQPPEGELLTVAAAASQLGLAPSTLLRWLNDGFIGGEQVTPGAPWRIRMTDQLKRLIVPEAPAGYVAMPQAMRLLGVSRQTIMQRVKRGELDVVHVSRGRQKGLRIRVLDDQPQLFDQPSAAHV
ncbi:MAG: recombinase family protein [Verrucomicrobiales bacterium]|nr:recombinase family protein [Verrucomicrobiales bacterium]